MPASLNDQMPVYLFLALILKVLIIQICISKSLVKVVMVAVVGVPLSLEVDLQGIQNDP